MAAKKRKTLVPGRKTDRSSSLVRRGGDLARARTWTIPLVLVLAVLALYAANPTESNVLHRFIFLSYEISPGAAAGAPPQYGKGVWDVAFVAFYTIVLSFTREFIMQELLHPLALRCGLQSPGRQLRFMEQMYTAVYFALVGPAGLYVMSRTPVWYFDTAGMYEHFPHRTHEAGFKFYYLFQAAYWVQQAIVLLLGMEKPRKDFKELVGHHVVTLSLIFLSYRFHFTYMGIAVFVTHDVSDFFLATSLSLSYINSPFVGPYYGMFLCVWVYLRHYVNLRIIWSLFTEYKTVGPYELNWETEQYKCWIANYITLALLAMLQALNLFWLFWIVRSAYLLVVHSIAKDDRSDGEEPGPEEIELDSETANTSKVEAAPLLGDSQSANGSATGVIQATSNGTVRSPTKRKRAR